MWHSLARGRFGVPDVRARRRLLVVSMLFCLGFVTVGAQVSQTALFDEQELRPRALATNPISSTRADVVDRHGRILATNVESYTVYAHPGQMIEPLRAATELADTFPSLERDRLYQLFKSPRKFAWVIRDIGPAEAQIVHDIGEPGLLIAKWEKRFYPNGAIAAHLLGGVSRGREGVAVVETLGSAGLEKHFDSLLKDETRAGLPFEVSIDLALQLAVEEVLERVVRQKIAAGAASVLMKPETGEILALSSAPDFDPNNHSLSSDEQTTSLGKVNIAVARTFEPASLFNAFTFAKAIDLGVVDPSTSFPINQNLRDALGLNASDHAAILREAADSDDIPAASVPLAARLGLRVGPQQLRTYFQELGFLGPLTLELSETKAAAPITPNEWSDTSAMYLGAGSEFSVSLIHLAQAYSALANDGELVPATLLKNGESDTPKTSLFSAQTAWIVRDKMRSVTEQDDSFGRISGYDIAASVGFSRKSSREGSRQTERTTAVFAAMFPVDKPRYVLLVMLEEPLGTVKETQMIGSNILAASVGREVFRRVAPLLYIKPPPPFE